MKLTPIFNWLKKQVPFLVFIFVLLWTLQIFYRNELMELFIEAKPIYGRFSFLAFMKLYFWEDLITSFLLLGLFSPLLLIPSRLFKTRLFTSLFFIQLLIFILSIGLGYFQFFEAALDIKMLGSGLSTYLTELTHSIRSQISPQVIQAFTGFTILNLLFYCLFYLLRKYQYFIRQFRIPKPHLTLSGFAFTLIILFTISGRTLYSKKISGKAHRILKKRLKELGPNPVKTVSIYLLSPKKTNKINLKRPDFDPKKFRFGLNTDSLSKPKKYPPLHWIKRGKKYNIILYFFESTANQYIGIKKDGKSITPTWDKLKKNSFVAQNHYAHFPFTVNALFSVFSSAYEYPGKNWMIMSRPKIKLKTVSEILKENGYRTGLFYSGDLAGFGHRKYLKHRKLDTTLEFRDLVKSNPKLTWNTVDDQALIQPVLQFAKKAQDKPFFAAVFPVLPHHPYDVPHRRFRLYPGAEKEKSVKIRDWKKYQSSLYYADYTLGQLVKKLEENDLLEDTLLFVFGDHGEAFFQHRGNYIHSIYLYEENVHVPFLIYNKKLFKRPFLYPGVSRHIDILPTILDALGLEKEEEHEGISLFDEHRQQMALLHAHWNKDFIGLRDGKWKYILRVKTGKEELYNLEKDPGEKINLTKRRREISKKFKAYVLKAREYKKGYFYKVLKKK